MNLIDLFKEFHSRAVVCAYPLSARVLYFTLLGDFNAAYFPEERVYSERELSGLTGLSPEPVHRALKFLADRGHIKTKKTKRGTVIQLCTCQAPAKHEPSTCQAPAKQSISLISYTQNQDEKTKKEEEESAGASESKLVTDSTEMDVHDLWEHETGFALHGSVAYELESLEKTYGRESFHSALIKAVQSNTANRLNFNYFKKVLENLNKPKPTSKKGGERNDNATENQRGYKQPDTSKDPDWRKYLKQ